MHTTRQRDSKAVLICPYCGAYRYVNQEYLDFLTNMEAQRGPDFQVAAALPRHKPCNAIMSITLFPKDIPDPITVNDLARVFIRAQDSAGLWESIDVQVCTDEQFDTWARTRIEIKGDATPWSLAERADFCDRLYMLGGLHILKKNSEEPEEDDPVAEATRKPTSDILAEALEEVGAPPEMITRARDGYYDDFRSPLDMPITALVQDARTHGLESIATRARHGEFDEQDSQNE